MSDAIDAKPFPRSMLLAAAALVFTSLFSALTAKTTGVGATRLEIGEAKETHLIRLHSLDGGGTRVTSAQTGREIVKLTSQRSGFAGVVLKGLQFDRRRAGADADAPFKLVKLANGHAILTDPETGRTLMVDAFGPDNTKAFSQIFDKERNAP